MNKHNVLTALSLIVIFITTYAIVTCAWVGAEYILDKAVHTSSVDRMIATALAYYHRDGINRFCGTDFSYDDMRIIYTYLGNRCNHEKTLRFIRSGYDMAVLTTKQEE